VPVRLALAVHEVGVELAGYTCRIKVDQQPFDGKKRNNIKDVFQASENAEGFLDNLS